MDAVEHIKGIEITPLKMIEHHDGNVMHALKADENSFSKFGEAYFSTVKKGSIKGWKKHTKMISNLVVPHGEVQFVFYDDRSESETNGKYFTINLSPVNYQRITVAPGLWMAFKGRGNDINLVLNVASIQHDPQEAINDPILNSKLVYPL